MDQATHTLGAYKDTIPCLCYSIVKGCDSTEGTSMPPAEFVLSLASGPGNRIEEQTHD